MLGNVQLGGIVLREQAMSRLLLLIGVLTTISVNPWFAYDPINLPKMLVLCTGAAFLLGILILNLKAYKQDQILTLVASLIFIGSLVFSFFTNESPWYQQLWGTWGRSTGLLTYAAFIIMLLSSTKLTSKESLIRLRSTFERLGYFMSLYTLLQFLDLDPVGWSQKLMVATLGNINFMSSFLGLSAISYTARVFLDSQSLSSKIHYLFFTCLNLFLIWESESIQGLAVYFSGFILLLTFFIRRNNSAIKSFGFLLVCVVFGTLGFLGTAGLGPLSTLRQETVIFRIDYWQAAINMLLANMINGIGIDSYGDFYREYRSVTAVTRTGPQRVTNTAHNIFLDIFTGAGVFSGLVFLFLVATVLYVIFLSLRDKTSDSNFYAIASMAIGFIVFCLISINQIGVGIWGFIFMGVVIGYRNRMQSPQIKSAYSRTNFRSSKDLIVQKEIGPDSLKRREAFFGGVLSLVVFFATLVPNIIDAQVFRAMKNSDVNRMMQLNESVGIQDFHRFNIAFRLSGIGRERESLEVATSSILANKRNWQSWTLIASNKYASKNVRLDAIQKLIQLDPHNEQLKEFLESVESTKG